MINFKKVAKQLVLKYFFQIVIFILTPLFIALLTRNFSLKDYGAYSLIAVTISIISSFLDLGLSQFIISKLSAYNKLKKNIYFFSILIFEIFFLLSFFFFIYVFNLKIFIQNFISINSNIFLYFSLIIIITSIHRLISSYFMAKQEIEKNIFFSFLVNHLRVIFIFIFFSLFNVLTLKIVLFIWLISSTIVLLGELIFIFSDIKLFLKHSFNTTYVKSALIFSLPLIFFALSSWFISFGDKYLLSYFIGLESVALYTVPYNLVNLLFTTSVIVSGIMFPYLSEAWHKKKNYNFFFNLSLKYGLLLLIPASIGFLFLDKQIILLISGLKYLDSIQIIPYLIFFPLLNLISYLFYQNLLFRNKTKQVSLIYLIGAILNFVLNLFLIPLFDVVGAAISTLITYFFIFIITYLITKKYFKFNFKLIKIEKILFSSLVMLMPVYFIHSISLLGSILSGAVVYGLCLFLFKVFGDKELKFISRFFKISK